jgi:DNA-binding beta-propeller fold protein YncE
MKRFQYRLLFFAFALVNITQTLAQEFRILDMKLKDICYSSVNDRIYGAVPGDLVQGNSIAVINPNTGVVEQSIPIGSEPTLVRISNNGRYLYVGLYGSPIIQLYDLLTNTLDPAIDLELFVPPPYDTHYPIFTGDIQPIPQLANSIIASRNDLNTTPGFSGITAYDDTTARALKIDGGVIGGDQIVVTETGQTLWGLGHAYAPTAFQRYQITAQAFGIAFGLRCRPIAFVMFFFCA